MKGKDHSHIQYFFACFMLYNQAGGSNFLNEHAVIHLIGKNWFFLLKLQENPRKNMVVREG